MSYKFLNVAKKDTEVILPLYIAPASVLIFLSSPILCLLQEQLKDKRKATLDFTAFFLQEIFVKQQHLLP